ncbi:MAG TPA: arsinothricin resistance N-acetyltransferase ArsN1 family B [Candidatus Binatia bacterium]|nr:arsinothricin resistance N-acetyltransferase ArsN1 family B [Candidatus Binatia bacterium]
MAPRSVRSYSATVSSIIRLAAADDAAAIQAIYAPIVRDTAISFEVDPPSVDEMRRRIDKTIVRWPWLVCERDGEVCGYVYASQHRERAAYRWSVDVTVYIHERARRCGVGRALYTSLFKLLALQGYANAYAGITLPNAGSVGLHERLGFTPVGVYRTVGYKLGAWHDVGWWQLGVQAAATAPEPPLDLAAGQRLRDWGRAIAAGESLLAGV